jgi:hypothetical protein
MQLVRQLEITPRRHGPLPQGQEEAQRRLLLHLRQHMNATLAAPITPALLDWYVDSLTYTKVAAALGLANPHPVLHAAGWGLDECKRNLRAHLTRSPQTT